MSRRPLSPLVVSILAVLAVPNSAGADVLLEAPMPYDVGRFASGIVVADVTGDGAVDVVTSDALDHTLSIRPGAGDGTFGALQTIAMGTLEPRDVVAAEMTGDSFVDLAVALRFSDGLLAVLPGLGGGLFGPPVVFGTSSSAFSMAHGDLDGDTDDDIVIATSAIGDTIAVVFRNDGAGGFDAGTSHLIASAGVTYIADLEIADVDGDGKLDLLGMSANADAIGVLRGLGNDFDPVVLLPLDPVIFADGSPFAIAPAELDGDGATDLVVLSAAFNPDVFYLVVYMNDGAGVLTHAAAYGLPDVFHSFTTPAALAAADLDGDGRDEVVIPRYMLRNFGDGSLGPPESYGIVLDVLAATTGDIDADGDADVVITDNSNFTSDSIILMNGRAGAADFDSDGTVSVADLLIVLADWGACPAGGAACPRDIDGTGSVDIGDLLEVLANWSS